MERASSVTMTIVGSRASTSSFSRFQTRRYAPMIVTRPPRFEFAKCSDRCIQDQQVREAELRRADRQRHDHVNGPLIEALENPLHRRKLEHEHLQPRRHEPERE